MEVHSRKKGNNFLWLTGGMRKAETGFSILPLFENEFFVIAPDYPPLHTMSEIVEGLASLLDKEGIEKTNVLGQSYGRLVAQGFLCRYPEYVEKLVLSSTAPLHGSLMKPWQLWLALLIAQTLPDKFMRRLFLKRLSPLLTVKEEERDFWQTYLEDLVMKRWERKDLLSHFQSAYDLARNFRLTPQMVEEWEGMCSSFTLTTTLHKKTTSRLKKSFILMQRYIASRVSDTQPSSTIHRSIRGWFWGF